MDGSDNELPFHWFRPIVGRRIGLYFTNLCHALAYAVVPCFKQAMNMCAEIIIIMAMIDLHTKSKLLPLLHSHSYSTSFQNFFFPMINQCKD